MSIATQLSRRDHHAALALVSESAAAHGAEPFERQTIETLLTMIPAERGGYFEYGGDDRATPDGFFIDAPTGGCGPDEWETDTVDATIGSWPLRDDLRGPAYPPLKMSDFVPRSRLGRNAWYCEVMRPSEIEYELKVWLSAPAGSVRGFFLVRGPRSRDFAERDRALLELLRPHLGHIRARWDRRRKPSILTRREAEVLELVASGLTNGEIAARLFISRTTVRTHLENIFEKLDVHTRTAAVARLRDLSAVA